MALHKRCQLKGACEGGDTQGCANREMRAGETQGNTHGEMRRGKQREHAMVAGGGACQNNEVTNTTGDGR